MSDTPVTTPLGDPIAPPPPIAPGPPRGSFVQNLLDVYFAPRDAFRRIVAHPTFLLPLLGQLVLVTAFTGIWLSKVDAGEFMRSQLEQSGRLEKLQPEQREAVMRMAGLQLKIGGVVRVLATPVVLLVVALVLMFVFRFFYAAEVGFRPSFGIVSWSFFAISLVTTPLLLLIMYLKGDWNLNPQEVLQANLGLLLDKASVAKPLWALATSLDLISFWYLFLLAVGFGIACRKSTGQAFWGVAIPWALMVLVKVAWSAIF